MPAEGFPVVRWNDSHVDGQRLLVGMSYYYWRGLIMTPLSVIVSMNRGRTQKYIVGRLPNVSLKHSFVSTEARLHVFLAKHSMSGLVS